MRRSVTCLLLLFACSQPETNIRLKYPVIAVFPEEELAFGDVVVLNPLALPLNVQNVGDGDLEITEVALDDASGVYELLETGPKTLAPDETWALPIEFLPDTYLDYPATLTITSNDEDRPELAVPLTGRGVHAPTPDIEVTPIFLDFATVAQGSSTTLWVDLKNVGSAPLTMGVVGQTGSGAFQLTSDPSQAVVSAGSTIPVLITYAPGNDMGDSGVLTFPSDDPDEPEVAVTLIGNGGGDFEYPVADIDCPGTSAPPEWVHLDGSASVDPEGGTLDYFWTLPIVPAGSAGHLLQNVTPTTELYTDIAGEYEVQLTVINEIGAISPPARCFIDAIPADDLHIELTWDTPDHDFDLHLMENPAEYYQDEVDCTWCSPNPKWGAAGSDDDPRLDLDDQYDGPENINILDPGDGTYHVKVHYFDGAGAVTATVKVWAYGAEVYVGSKVMKYDEVWDVGQVNWPDGTFAPATTPLYKSPYRNCW